MHAANSCSKVLCLQLVVKHDVLRNMGMFELEEKDWEVGYRHIGAQPRPLARADVGVVPPLPPAPTLHPAGQCVCAVSCQTVRARSIRTSQRTLDKIRAPACLLLCPSL
jgi:hypothetical protein